MLTKTWLLFQRTIGIWSAFGSPNYAICNEVVDQAAGRNQATGIGIGKAPAGGELLR